MKLSEARKIVEKMFNIAMTNFMEPKPGISLEITESLEDLIKANKMVKAANEKALDRSQKTGGTVSIAMTIDESIIAAIYAAANCYYSSAQHPQPIVRYNGAVLLLIK